MPDLREYGSGIARDVVPPDLEDLARVARRRRTLRNAAVLTPITGLLVVAVVLGFGGHPRASTPPATSSTPSVTRAIDRTAEDIIANGTVERVTFDDDALGPTVGRWRHCNEVRVTRSEGQDVVESAGCGTAIEIVAPDGRRSAFATGAGLPWVVYAGEGSVLFGPRADPGSWRLASASMSTPRPVTVASGYAAPRPGIRWVEGVECPCAFDRATATLTVIDLPPISGRWAKATSGGFWGLEGSSNDAGDRLTFSAFWVDADGGTHSHSLVADEPREVFIADGGASGEMAFYERPLRGASSDDSRFLHISTDRGASWQTRILPQAVPDEVLVAEELHPDWRAWPLQPKS